MELLISSVKQLRDVSEGLKGSLSRLKRLHGEAIAQAKKIGAQKDTYTPATLQDRLDAALKTTADAVEKTASDALTTGEEILPQEKYWTPEAVLRRAALGDNPATEPAARANLREELKAADHTEFLARLNEFVETGDKAGVYQAILALPGRPDGGEDRMRVPVLQAKFDVIAANPEVTQAKELFFEIKTTLSQIRNLAAVHHQTASLAEWLEVANAMDKRATLVRPGRLS